MGASKKSPNCKTGEPTIKKDNSDRATKTRPQQHPRKKPPGEIGEK